ncbi:MAG: NADH-quinone oxidoreductase subunit NuoK [Candidatus Asgardarchaeia archaeon]
MISIYDYVILSLVLLVIGIYGLSTSRNAVRMLMSVEIILNAANINLIVFTAFFYPEVYYSWVFVTFMIALAAAEAAIGLAIFLALYHVYGTAELDLIHKLRDEKVRGLVE